MALGPGRYDSFCTDVRMLTGAQGVLLIVLNGILGSGFSCQADAATTTLLPDILENIARQIRRDGPFRGQRGKADE